MPRDAPGAQKFHSVMQNGFDGRRDPAADAIRFRAEATVSPLERRDGSRPFCPTYWGWSI